MKLSLPDYTAKIYLNEKENYSRERLGQIANTRAETGCKANGLILNRVLSADDKVEAGVGIGRFGFNRSRLLKVIFKCSIPNN